MDKETLLAFFEFICGYDKIPNYVAMIIKTHVNDTYGDDSEGLSDYEIHRLIQDFIDSK